MKPFLISGSGWELLFLLLLFLAFGVPLLLIIFGVTLRYKNKRVSKILLITVMIYILIGTGVCGVLMI